MVMPRFYPDRPHQKSVGFFLQCNAESDSTYVRGNLGRGPFDISCDYQLTLCSLGNSAALKVAVGFSTVSWDQWHCEELPADVLSTTLLRGM